MFRKTSVKETPFTHLKDVFRWGTILGFFPGEGPNDAEREFTFSNWLCAKCIFSSSLTFLAWTLIYGSLFIKGGYFRVFREYGLLIIK
jgi:hypothetical protein